MTDFLKAVFWSILIVVVLGIAIIGDCLHWLFWHTVGRLIISFQVRYIVFSDRKPAWEKWLLILGVKR